MTLTNAYASLDEFLAQPDIKSDEPVDDVFIESLLDSASRDGVDAYTGSWFYAYTQTRTYDMPKKGRELELDAPLLSVTTLTNGDGTIIPASLYQLRPYNGPHYTSIKLNASSSVIWTPGLSGDTEGVITVAGKWGYVDRTASDPASRAVIASTNSACLAIAVSAYKKRYGVGVEGVAKVTGAGVVITPSGIPPEAKISLDPLRRLL